jgi:hypothetical protein
VRAPVVERVGTYGKPTNSKNTVYNKAVTSTVVALNINLTGLVQVMDKLEETIIREFGTPRFLINKTPENRATAYVEFEVFISGPTVNAQRTLSVNWSGNGTNGLSSWHWQKTTTQEMYPFGLSMFGNPSEPATSTPWHRQSPTSTATDKALAQYPGFAFDMMGWDKKALQQQVKKP